MDDGDAVDAALADRAPLADVRGRFAAGSRVVFCGDSVASTVDLGPIAGDPLELERGLLLAGLLATLKPVGGGRLSKMSAEEWLEGWRKLRGGRGAPETIDVSPEARRAWHAARAAGLTEEYRWDAAAWHLDRLAALGDDVRARRARLEEFVRSWRFAPDTVPWPDPSDFVPLDDARLASVEEAALAAPLILSPSPRVDFTGHFAGEWVTWMAAYAARSIECAAPREVRILIGWDDSVRVFVNRKRVLVRRVQQQAEPDQLSEVASLEAGTNVLLVELSNGWGVGALFLRLEDPVTGRKLRLTDDGKLEDL